MADLRIVDAPEIPTENITGEEKLPTGGSGNYSISLDSLADYTKTKKDLADNTSVDNKVNGVRQELDAHIEDLLNPHQVTKGQIGLGNVDNTADADKPVSNSTQASIISAVAPKADKTYVDTQLALKANKADVYTKQESNNLVNNSISTALTPVNSSLDLAKRGIANRYDSSLTYNSGERVVLTNGDIVKSTIDGNANDPNVDMTGWVLVNSDSQITTWSGRTQESKNKDEINVLDFGVNPNVLADYTVNIQNAVNYASSLVKNDEHRVTVVINDPVILSIQRMHSTGWGSAVIVPKNVDITGKGCIYVQSDYEHKIVGFLVRGSNVCVSWLTCKDTNPKTGNNWSVLVGGGSAYDDALPEGIYENIQCYQLLGLGNWLTCSFQMSHTTSNNNTYFDGIEYIFCKSFARKDNTSSGNFNFVSNPPHHIRNTKMIGCSAKFGATSTSFNHVGVDGGSISNCDSELNLYGACELESLTRNFTVNSLRSKNDMHCLWIDDSYDITFNGLNMENTIDNLQTVSFGNSYLNRAVLRISYTKDDDGNPVVLKNIVGSDIKGKNSRVIMGAFGTPVEGSKIGDVSLSNIVIDNDGISRVGGNIPLVFSGIDTLSITQCKITGTAQGAYQVQGAANKRVDLIGVTTEKAGSEVPLGLYINGTADLFLERTDFQALNTLPTGKKYYKNTRLAGIDQPDRKVDAYEYSGYTGNPEGVLSANLGTIVKRQDQPRMYVKSTATGSSGWRAIAFVDEII